MTPKMTRTTMTYDTNRLESVVSVGPSTLRVLGAPSDLASEAASWTAGCAMGQKITTVLGLASVPVPT